MHKGDAAVAGMAIPQPPGLVPLVRLQLLQERAQHGAQQRTIIGEAIADLDGKAEHPLTDRHRLDQFGLLVFR
jgi:hypothetical protein